MAKILLSAVTNKYALIIVLSMFGASQIIYAIKECFRKRKRENFYLLSVRLINAAEQCETFDELDKVKAEFFYKFKMYGWHEDFADCYAEVNSAIKTRFWELHENNFTNGDL